MPWVALSARKSWYRGVRIEIHTATELANTASTGQAGSHGHDREYHAGERTS